VLAGRQREVLRSLADRREVEPQHRIGDLGRDVDLDRIDAERDIDVRILREQLGRDIRRAADDAQSRRCAHGRIAVAGAIGAEQHVRPRACELGHGHAGGLARGEVRDRVLGRGDRALAVERAELLLRVGHRGRDLGRVAILGVTRERGIVDRREPGVDERGSQDARFVARAEIDHGGGLLLRSRVRRADQGTTGSCSKNLLSAHTSRARNPSNWTPVALSSDQRTTAPISIVSSIVGTLNDRSIR
jgi:hypothetical protein